jgi:hypothetical protein
MDEEKLKQLSDQYELNPATPQEIPESTLWPIVMAFGVIFLFWGLITTLFISGIGLIAMAVAVSGWIGDLKP